MHKNPSQKKKKIEWECAEKKNWLQSTKRLYGANVLNTFCLPTRILSFARHASKIIFHDFFFRVFELCARARANVVRIYQLLHIHTLNISCIILVYGKKRRRRCRFFFVLRFIFFVHIVERVQLPEMCVEIIQG